jgi:hypothetical protein
MLGQAPHSIQGQVEILVDIGDFVAVQCSSCLQLRKILMFSGMPNLESLLHYVHFVSYE